MRVAAIDIGSNTMLLLVASLAADGTISIHCDECRFARLSEGLRKTGELSAAALERGLGVCGEFSDLLRQQNVEQIRIVGTQALREAKNAKVFLDAAKSILGAPVEVIPGPREAELVEISVKNSMPQVFAHPTIVADVGGASTEVISLVPGVPATRVSVPIGAVNLSEAFLSNDAATREQVLALEQEIHAQLAKHSLPRVDSVVGTAGTATSIASVFQKLPSYDATKTHGTTLSVSQLQHTVDSLLTMTVEQKRILPGLAPQRADVIAGGAAIYRVLVAQVNASQLIICDRGIRWGLVYEMFAQT